MLIQIRIQFINLDLVISLQLLLLGLQVGGCLVLDLVELLLELELQVQQLVNHLGVHFFEDVVLDLVQLVDLVGVVWINLRLVIGLALFITVGLTLIRISTFINRR